jgi:hypothetical protein
MLNLISWMDYKLTIDIHNKRFIKLELCNRKVASMSSKQLFSFWVHLIVLPCRWPLIVTKMN